MASNSIPKGVIKDIVIVVVGVLVIWFGLQAVFGTQNPFYVVSSGSMVPELQVYDVLVVQGNDPFEEVRVGDIIVFNRPSGHDRVIVHRVSAIIDEDPYTIRTKGDANPASIPGTDFPITKEEYIGQVEYVIPQVGYITRILTPPINYIIIAVIVGIMIVKQITKKKKEEKKIDPFKRLDDSEDGYVLNDKEKFDSDLVNTYGKHGERYKYEKDDDARKMKDQIIKKHRGNENEE